jgi:DNA-binding NtrC family response regulator
MTPPTKQTILIVDPERDFVAWASKHLAAPSVKVIGVTNGEDAMKLVESESVDVVVVELRMGPMNGMQLLQRLRGKDPDAMVILTTGFPMTSAIIEAMKYGAYEFLRKETITFEIRAVIESALKAKEALNASDSTQTPANPEEAAQEHFIGNAPAMQEVFKMIGRVSRADAPVMITGESGVGKEVVAKAIHRFSLRTKNEFVAINCAAIPQNLLESELFGHEKGAFTGAFNRREGRFEQCSKGTLFLDEIGEMPLEVQSKLLRVLQEGQYSRVGGNDTLTTGARILAATNKDLEAEVAAGRFREDLFYRLNVVRIHIPPLRQRQEDVPLLARFFLQRLSSATAGIPFRFSQEALDSLTDYHWPGNVRELENTIQRAVVLANTSVLLPSNLPLGQMSPAAPVSQSGGNSASDAIDLLFESASEQGKELLPWLEREFTQRAMERTNNNQVQAAKLLGITRATLRKRVERFNLVEKEAG